MADGFIPGNLPVAPPADPAAPQPFPRMPARNGISLARQDALPQAVAMTPDEQAQEVARDRSPTNLAELDSAIASAPTAQARSILESERTRIQAGPAVPAAAEKPPTWAEVSQLPEMKRLSADDYAAARHQYFVDVVAPMVPTDQLDAARAAFDKDTAPGVLDTAARKLSGVMATARLHSKAMDFMKKDVDAFAGDILQRAVDGSPARGGIPRSLRKIADDVLSAPGLAAQRQANEERGVKLDPITHQPLRTTAPKLSPDQVSAMYSLYERELFDRLRKTDQISTDEDIANRIADYSRRGDGSLLTPDLLANTPQKLLPKHAVGKSWTDVAENIVRSGVGGAPARALNMVDTSFGGLQWMMGEIADNQEWRAAGQERYKNAKAAGALIAKDNPANIHSKFSEYAQSGLDSIPLSLGSAALWNVVGKGAKGAVAGLTPFYLQSQGEHYGEMQSMNFNHGFSMFMSALMGASDAGTELIALPAMGRLLRSKEGQFIQNGLDAIWKEGGTEGINAVLQGITKKASTEPNYSLQNLKDDVTAAIVSTGITVPGIAAVGKVSRMIERGLGKVLPSDNAAPNKEATDLPANDGGDSTGPIPKRTTPGAAPVSADDLLGSVEAAPEAAAVAPDQSVAPKGKPVEVAKAYGGIMGEDKAEGDALANPDPVTPKPEIAANRGASTTFTTERGTKLEGEYAVVEADDLTVSHDINLKKNEAFPQALQPRDRSRAAYDVHITGILNRLNPEQLGDNPLASHGAPIVGEDGVVESGNGRVIVLQKAYNRGDKQPQAGQYRTWLTDNAQKFGLDAESVKGMKQPVLVRVRTTPVNRAEFARQANQESVARMSPLELAKSDAARIGSIDDFSAGTGGEFATSGNDRFIRRFVATLPATEQTEMVDSKGRLSQSGLTRVRNAVLARAYGDSETLMRLVESVDDGSRNISKALLASAPRIAKLREDIAAGALHDLDITPDLMKAVDEITRIRDDGQTVGQVLAQLEMFGGKGYSAETIELLSFLDANIRSPRRIAELVDNYLTTLQGLGSPKQTQLIERTAPTKRNVMTESRKGLSNERTEDDGGLPAGTGTTAQTADGAGAGTGEAGAKPQSVTGKTGPRGGVKPRAAKKSDSGKKQTAAVVAKGVKPKPTPAAAATAKAFGSENKLFTKDKAEAARAKLRAKLGQLNVGIDPEVIQAGLELAGYYIEGGARSFSAYSSKMLADLGDAAKPYLKSWYLAVRNYPGFDNAGMQSESEIEAEQKKPSKIKAKSAAPSPAKDRSNTILGMDANVQRPRGSTRTGKDSTGKEWSVTMLADYGEFPGTKDVDGEPVDFYASPDATEDMPVFIIDQRRPSTGKLDEHKVILGSRTRAHAEALYDAHFSDGTGPVRRAHITELTLDELKDWLKSDDTLKPMVSVRAPTVKVMQQAVEKVGDDLFQQYVAEHLATFKGGALTPAEEAAEIEGVARRIVDGAYDAQPDGTGTKTGVLANDPVLVDGQLARVTATDEKANTVTVKFDDGNTRAVPVAELIISIVKAVPKDVAAADARSAEILKDMERKHEKMTPAERTDRAQIVQLVKDKVRARGARVKQQADGDIIEIKKGREFHYLMGPPAAGKSSIAKDVQARTGSRVIDADVAKELLPEFENGLGASALHLESAAIAEGLLAETLATGENILYPGVGKGIKTARKIIADARAAGYKVYLYRVDLPTEKTIDRAIKRFRQTGRYVPVSYIREVGNKPLEVFDIIGHEGVADGYVEYSNDVPYGHKPKVLPQRFGVRHGTGQDKPGAGAVAPSVTDQRGRDVRPGTERRADGSLRVEADADRETAGDQQRLGREGGVSHADRAGQDRLPVSGAAERGGAGDGASRTAKPVAARVANRGQMGLGFTEEGAADGEGGKPDTNAEGTAKAGSADSERREGGGPDAGRSGQRDSGTARNPAATLEPANYTITDDDALGEGGQKTKARNNIAAIRLIKQLAAEDRHADADEQAVLVKYVGWGGIKQAFDEGNAAFAKERAELKELLTADEYAAARRSVLDAHYTSATVVTSIYAALGRMGFTGGRTLEPAVGTGNFLGLMPRDMLHQSDIIGVELDSITGQITKQLYQKAQINTPRGFQDVAVPEGYFDLAIGNPPFGGQSIADTVNPDISKFSIHNFFFAKSVKGLRQGGLLAMVVSNSFLDARKSDARKWIAKRARLVGAIRLPNTAFQKNAGTEVTTDIIFLQRESPEALKAMGDIWVKVGTIPDPNGGEAIPLNQYFIDNPDMLLGRMTREGTMYRADSAALVPNEGEDLGAALARAVKRLPLDIYKPVTREQPKVESKAVVPSGVKIGGLFLLPDGKLGKRLPDVLDKAQHAEYEIPSARGMQRIKGMIGLRGALRNLMRAELDDFTDAALDRLRKELNKVYDQFVKKNGYVSSVANRRAFQDDPDLPLLEALESDYDPGVSKEVAKKNGLEPRVPSAKKAAIFAKRVLSPVQEVRTASSAADALAASLNARGRVDLDYMSQVYGKTAEEVRAELKDLLYDDPQEGLVTADAYLSGNVKAKLAQARAAAEKDAQYRPNIEALEKVQPADIHPADISVRLGSGWVPAQDVGDFIESLLKTRPSSLSYQRSAARWIVNIPHRSNTEFNTTWGAKTQEPASWDAGKIIEAVLNNTPITVRKNVGTSREPQYITLEAETDAAQAKADLIRQEFKDWIFKDRDRRDRLAKLYNDTYNTDVLRKFDGSHLNLPGTNPNIVLTENKRHSVWRAIQSKTMLLDHVVGSGKTFTSAAIMMELRRLGIARKPLLTVPNHITRQWRDEWYALYPNANILVATEEDFEKSNRRRLFGRIATGDWDGIIIGHTSLGKIPMPAQEMEAILNEQISEIAQAIAELKREKNSDGYSVRQMELLKARIEDKLKRARDRTADKDDTVDFAELGIDAMMVDELHEFKNLFYVSQMRNVTGMGNPEGAGKAFDLFVKARYLQKRGGRFYGASGTPISNSLVEMFTMQRYMDYDGLKARGDHHLDSWAGTFADIAQVWETHPSGNGYRLSTRFAKFVNLPELITQYRKFADVVTQQDMFDTAAKQGKRYPIPKMEGGKPKLHVAPRSPQQTTFFGVPEFQRDEDGNIRFKLDGPRSDYVMPEQPDEKDGKFYVTQAKSGHKVGSGQDTREAAIEQFELDYSTPLMQYNKGSILWKYENLRQLTKDSDGKINALSITNEARKAGLDYRMIDANAPDFQKSKVNAAIAEIRRIYDLWHVDKGTQLIFMDLSTPKAKRGAVKPKAAPVAEGDEAAEVFDMDSLLAGQSAFSAYDDIKTKLIASGIPESEIAYIHDANNADQKKKLFAKVNRGEIRILLGSTPKMGAGTNVQKRLVAEHHMDAPWRPSDLEQREGRILRQGNTLYERDPEGFRVEIHRYASEKTYDTRMWQIIEHKATGIEQLRRGQMTGRETEDISSEAANAADMKAAASGNPLIAEEIKLRDQLKKLENLAHAYKSGRYALENRVGNLERAPEVADGARKDQQTLIKARKAAPEKGFEFTSANGKTITDPKDLTAAVLSGFKQLIDDKLPGDQRYLNLGKFRGFDVTADYAGKTVYVQMKIKGGNPRQVASYGEDDQFSAQGFVQRMNNYLGSFEGELTAIDAREKAAAAELVKARAQLDKPFDQQAELDRVRTRHREVAATLQKQGGAIDLTPDMQKELEAERAKRAGDRTALSRKSSLYGGINIEDANAVANIFRRKFKGLPPMHVMRSPKQAPDTLRHDLKALGGEFDTAAAWHNGEIYVFTDNIRDPEHMAWSILHESAHHGLRGMFGSNLDAELMLVYESNARIRKDADNLTSRNRNLSLVRAVEEVLADMGGDNIPQPVWARLLAFVRRALRGLGMKIELSDADVRDLVARALRFAKNPQKQTHLLSGTATSRNGASTTGARAPTRTGLLDTALRVPTQLLGIDRLTTWAYDGLIEKVGALVPEKVKAGVVADYGMPEAVIDRRTLMQSHMKTALRQTQGAVEKLLGLTRAESRVAYQWMTGQEADRTAIDRLPADSQATLRQLRTLISSLGREAVRLGQLSKDTYERSATSYLHRSYLKHEVEQTDQQKARRGRAIKVLGDQYKGRGMVDGVPMQRVKAAAPEWWGRKLKNGKADKALKGEQFIRFERRANRGEGVRVLPGMDETGQRGKLLEVQYWPAGEPVPAKYGAWHRDSGTWEVRDVKGGDAVMWRDFTPEERTRMGEIDEVRYAVAKTMHQMIHDIEVGRYLEWLANRYARPKGEGLNVVDASERFLDTFKPGEWVKVPETEITGTSVKRYGALAGKFLPGPIWNDVRQVASPRFAPLGDTYATVLKAWKISKTALSPAVHMNNIMANVIMADWHDVRASDLVSALATMVKDTPENKRLLELFEDNGGTQGSYVLSEIQREQLRPLLDELRQDVDTAGGAGVINASAILQAMLHGGSAGERLQKATAAAADSKVAGVIGKAAGLMLDAYQAEDTVFRLAAFIKAKGEGASDAEAGKFARRSFLDYHINAPWIQAMRSTFFPFISFTYRAAPMLLETAAKKPWKLMKLALVLGGLNALGYLLSGGDEDDERKLLPEEKAGRIFGFVAPKLIRMPWNDQHGNPVFMDIRRFIPVGDLFDIGQTHAALPLLPVAIPGGPLALAAELLANRSQFTGRDITKETDTTLERTGKIIDHLYKAFAPNLPFLPGTYSATSILNAGKGKTDPFGREHSLPAALASSVGVKIASYPTDVAKRGVKLDHDAKVREISENISRLKREYQQKGISREDFDEKVQDQLVKRRKIDQEARERLR